MLLARPTRFERVTFAFGGQLPTMASSWRGFLGATHLQHVSGKPLILHERERFQLKPVLTGLRIDLQERHRCVSRPSRDLGGARAIGHLKQQAGHQVAPEQT